MGKQHGPLITRLVGWLDRTLNRKRAKPAASGKRRPKSSPREESEAGLSRMASLTGATFSLLLSTTLVVLVLALLYGFVVEYRRNVVVLDPISTPPALVERGFTATVVAQRLLDDANAIRVESFAFAQAPSLTSREDQVDINLLSNSLSMRSVVRYVRSLSGRPEPHVSGEITMDKGEATLWLRKGGERLHSAPTDVRESSNLDVFFRNGAEKLLELTAPWELYLYFFRQGAERGEWQKASDILDYIRDHADGESSSQYWFDRGTVAYLRDRHAESIEAFDRAIAMKKIPSAYIRKGLALASLGRRAEAIEMLDAAKQMPSLSAADWQLSGFVFRMLHLYEKELAAAQRCADLEPSNTLCAYEAAHALFGLHRYPAAIEALRHAPRGPPVVNGYIDLALAKALARSGDLKEASRIADELINRDPKSLYFIYAHAEVQLVAGKYAEAAAEFARYNAKLHDADAECEEARARLGTEERNGVEALIQSGKKRDASEPICRLAAGEWQMARGQYDMAEAEFREAVALDPNDPMLLRKWAGALAALGQKEFARAKETLANDLERRNREWKLGTR